MSQWYELVVFTASMEIYGCAVADKLDNNRSILNRRYYRQVGGARGAGLDRWGGDKGWGQWVVLGGVSPEDGVAWGWVKWPGGWSR